MSLRELLFGKPEPALWPVHDEASLVRCAQSMGYVCIKAHVPQNPHVGERWVPTRGQGIAHDRPLAEPRWVRSVGPDAVSYALEQDGWGMPIDMASWHRWVRRTRAVRG